VWYAVWRCWWAWLLAGRGPLRPTGLAGRFAGAAGGASTRPGVLVTVLAVRQLQSAAAGDGDARFAVCFMLLVSCTPVAKSAVYDFLV